MLGNIELAVLGALVNLKFLGLLVLGIHKS